MFRVVTAAVLAVSVLSFAVEAQAGIFFRRGGCAGGNCGAVYTMPAPTSAAAPSAAVSPEKEQVAQQPAATDSAAPAADAATSEQQTAASSSNYPVRRVGFRMGGFRLFGRWR